MGDHKARSKIAEDATRELDSRLERVPVVALACSHGAVIGVMGMRYFIPNPADAAYVGDRLDRFQDAFNLLDFVLEIVVLGG